MIICNISFIVEASRYEDLLAWLRGMAVPAVTAPGTPAIDATLATLVEVPGDPDFISQARNIALQVSFADIDDAHAWSESSLPLLLDDYTQRFGPEAVAFRTLLQSLPL